MAEADLLNRGTGTAASQLSEAEQGIMCAKEGIGKYDMWHGVVCKSVMSCTSTDVNERVPSRNTLIGNRAFKVFVFCLL